MSWTAVQTVIDLGRQPGVLTDPEFRLLLNLAERHNEQTGQLNPSVTRMAADMGRALDHGADLRPRDQAGPVVVRRLLRQLETKALVKRRQASRGGQHRGRRYPSQDYVLTLPAGRTTGSPSGGTQGSGRGNRRFRAGGTESSPNLGTEPLKEPTAASPAPSQGSGSAAESWRDLGPPQPLSRTAKQQVDQTLAAIRRPSQEKAASNGDKP